MSSYLALPLGVVGLCLILVALVLRRDPRGHAHRIFAFFLAAMGAWGMLIFGMRASPTLEQAYFWEKGVFPAITFTAIFYYHFTLVYTSVPRIRGLLAVAYAFAAVVTALSSAGMLATGMQLKPYGYAPVISPAFYFFFAGSIAFTVLGIVNLGRAYRVSRLYDERNRYLYLMVAASLTILGGALDVLPILGFPAYPGAIIANVIFGLLTGVAVLRYRLLDIRIVIRRGVAYFLLSALVAMPYVGIVLLFGQFLGQAMPFWGYVVLLVILAPTLRPLWQRVQATVDRWFYRERYDVFRELERFSEETHSVSDLNQIAHSLTMLMRRALQASHIFLLLPTGTGDFQVASSTDEAAPPLTLSPDSPLLQRLRSSKRPLNRHDLDTVPELRDSMLAEESQWPSMQAELFVPLTTKERELVGLIILSQKRSGQPYSDEDERLVLSVASRMALEIENARLYALERSMRRELERQNEQKTEFLHSVAHELKTPLTAIVSSSQVLNEDLQSDKTELRQRLLNNINRSAWLMDRKAGELLDRARTQLHSLELNLELHDIREVIGGVTRQLALLFDNKRQRLLLDMPDSVSPIPLDRERIEQVLLNLLTNANKFSPSGSEIAVRVMTGNDHQVVSVTDSAALIAEEDRPRLFDAYYRGGSEGDRQRVPGLGLGLSISRRIVELHGGKIWLEGETGKGNAFLFSLPLAQPERNRERLSPSSTGGRR